MAESTQFPSLSLEVISAITTAWLPLPTRKLPPNEDCYHQIYEGPSAALIAFDVVYQRQLFPTATICLPEEVTSWWLQDSKSQTTTRLGPKFECPEMYKSVWGKLEASGTEYIQCCPTGYKLNKPASPKGIFPSQCTSAIIEGQVVSYGHRVGNSFIIMSSTHSGAATFVNAQHVNGYNVLLSSSTSESRNPTTSTTIAPDNSTTPTQITPTISAPPSGLRTPAKIGIGVGVGVGVLSLIGILALAFFALRRRKVQKEEDMTGQQQEALDGHKNPKQMEWI